MFDINLKAFLLIFCVLLNACSLSKNKISSSVATPSNSEIEKQLLDVAYSVERSLALLAMSQEEKSPSVLNTTPLITPEGGMGGTADIDWTGPIEPLLHKLASMTNYKVKSFGSAPAIPIIVSITQNKSVIADILKNASLQAGNKAHIMVFPANKVIEIRYKSS